MRDFYGHIFYYCTLALLRETKTILIIDMKRRQTRTRRTLSDVSSDSRRCSSAIPLTIFEWNNFFSLSFSFSLRSTDNRYFINDFYINIFTRETEKFEIFRNIFLLVNIEQHEKNGMLMCLCSTDSNLVSRYHPSNLIINDINLFFGVISICNWRCIQFVAVLCFCTLVPMKNLWSVRMTRPKLESEQWCIRPDRREMRIMIRSWSNAPMRLQFFVVEWKINILITFHISHCCHRMVDCQPASAFECFSSSSDDYLWSKTLWDFYHRLLTKAKLSFSTHQTW